MTKYVGYVLEVKESTFIARMRTPEGTAEVDVEYQIRYVPAHQRELIKPTAKLEFDNHKIKFFRE